MRSRLLILLMVILSIAVASQAFGASTLTPYPTKAPKGAYVNGGGNQTHDNYFWQMLTLTTVDAVHSGGTGITFYLPTDMTVADVNNDGNYTGEISYVWDDAAGGDLLGVTAAGVNSTASSITFSNGFQYAKNGFITGAATNWVLGGSAAYNADNVNIIVGGVTGTAAQNIGAAPGQTYVVMYTISGKANDPSVTVSIGGTNGTARTADGTYTDIITAVSTDSLKITAIDISGDGSDAAATIDDIFVYPSKIQNGDFTGAATGWVLGTGWSYGADKVTKAAGVIDSLVQNVGLVSGRKYTLRFTATRTAGSVTPYVGGAAGTAVTAAGPTEYVMSFTSTTSKGNLAFVADATFAGTIDGVYLTEERVTNGTFDAGIGSWAAGGAAAWNAGGYVDLGVGTLSQALATASGDVYTITFAIGGSGGGTSVTVALGGVTGTAITADGTYTQTFECSGAGTGNLVFSNAAGTATLDNVRVIRNHSTMGIGDKLYVMVPVVTAESPSVSSDDWWVDFSDGTNDDISNGSGTAVTYVTPGPTALQLVTFADNLSADNDTTNALGDRYPTDQAATFSALPDLVIDGPGEAVIQSPNVGIVGSLDAAEDISETRFAVWISTASDLAHIDSLSSGISHALKLTDLTNYLVPEADLGGIRYAVGGLPEGSYYFYITSYVTGDFVLARSGRLVIRHWPVVNLIGFDYDHDDVYTQGSSNDDKVVYLDTGSYYNFAGAKATTGHKTFIDLYASVDDLDDNAKVHLFYSASAALDTSAVQKGGSAGSGTMTITGLTGANPLVGDLLENSKDAQGYIKWRWQVHPDSIHTVIPAGNYSVYCVTCDGKHFDIKSLKGGGTTNLTTNILHSPNLTLDALTEYDTSGGSAGIQIDVKSLDTIMLSWGKSGINGALDYDDAAIISFYIHQDDNTTSDYKHTGYNAGDTSTIWNDAATAPTTTHRIVTGLQENLDSKGNMYYTWNLKNDFKATGWYPVEGANYFLYAVIDENKTDGTVRCVTLGPSGNFFDETTSLAGQQIVFTTTAFNRLVDPPAEGVTINAEETYRMRFNAFDWDTDANMGVFVVKNTSTGYVDGPATTTTAAIDTLGSTAYMLNDNDGDYHATNTTVSENSSTYYDATIRVPGSTTAKYTKTMGGASTTLADGTYWVYIGSTKETSFADKVTNGTFTGSATGWTLGGAVWNAGGYLDLTTGDTPNQDVSVVVGHTYLVKYVITIVAPLTVQPSVGGVSGVTRSVSGTYYEVVTATSTAVLTFTCAGGGGSGTLDNVSVSPYATLYRAPGPLTVVNAGIAAVQRNLTVSPMEATVAQGDTVSFIIRAADNGADNIDRIDAYVAVEKAYWTIVTPSAPFTASLAYTGMLIANQAINDSTNNRWILRTVAFNGGTDFDISDNGTGDAVATLQLVSKGTTAALQSLTSVYFVNEPARGWVTKFSNGGGDISINTLASTVKVIPRPIIEGIVELQGRSSMSTPITFELRKRGSYVAVSDSIFSATNDANASVPGVQYTPDADGKFTFTKVPTGEYDFVASYNRYLSKLVPVNVYPGLDTLFISFGTLRGGDCYGYKDSTGAAYPDNQIDSDDVNRISTAFLATSSNSKWNNGTDNWKWADTNEDGIVEADDLSMATANVPFGGTGAQPQYKIAGQPVSSNIGALVEFMNVPNELKAGVTYTVQVIARNTTAVRAYFVNLNYNKDALSFAGIRKGGFIASDSHSFPVIGNGQVGLANSVYGEAMFSGDGVLAEVSFTALRDGAFTADMISFDKVEFVNSDFIREDLADDMTSTGSGKAPLVFALGQNFPNPFNPVTNIGFTLPENGHVSIDIYDILGRHVRTLAAGMYSAGQHSVLWDAKDANGRLVSAGTYVYTIKAGKFTSSKRMLFMK